MAAHYYEKGLDVPHEDMGHDGTSSCFYALTRLNWAFDKVIHVVRDPIKVINELCDICRAPQFLAHFGLIKSGNGMLWEAIRFYAEVAGDIEADEIQKIEDLNSGIHIGKEIVMVENLDWDMILLANPYYAPQAKEVAEGFGYGIS